MPLLFIATLFCLLFSGCSAIIETQGVEISRNLPEPPDLSDGDFISVSTQEELERAILDMVKSRSERDLFRIEMVSPYDIRSMILDAIEKVHMEPLAAYATGGGIAPLINEGHGYAELELVITYRKTAAQIAGLRTFHTEGAAISQLSHMLRAGESYLAMSAPPHIANTGFIEHAILDYYYSQALEVILLPQVHTGLYLSGTDDHGIAAVELDFGFTRGEIAQMRIALQDTAASMVDALPENLSTQEQIRSLAEALADRVIGPLEEEPQADLRELRPLSTTAFGALVQGAATSEGYAMAFKALMDLLGVDSHVVQGEREDGRHVWNIVGIGDYYYHVDISLLAFLGPEYTLFLSDESMLLQKGYSWDVRLYPHADGPALVW